MRVKNKALISSPTIVASSYTSDPIYLVHSTQGTVQIVTSAAACSVKLQYCIDESDDMYKETNPVMLQNWQDIDGSVQSLSGVDSGTYEISDIGYKYVRLVVTGSATITLLQYNSKGI